MDEYGYGLAQIRKKVVPLLISRIRQLLIDEGRQNEAASRLSQAISLRVEVLKEMTGSIDSEDDDHG